jgi:hypothetical protein
MLLIHRFSLYWMLCECEGLVIVARAKFFLFCLCALGVRNIFVDMQTAEFYSIINSVLRYWSRSQALVLGAPADHHAFLLMGEDLKPQTSLRLKLSPFSAR